MAFGKLMRLVVGNGSSEDAVNDAVDVSDLDIQFRVFRSNKFGESRAEFTIWNPSQETQAKFMRTDFTDVNFWAGYLDGEYGLIFAGHVLDIHPEWSGADRKVVLNAVPLRANGFTEDDNKKIQIENPERTRLTSVRDKLQAELNTLDPKKDASRISTLTAQISSYNAQIKTATNDAILKGARTVIDYQFERETKRISANTYLSLVYAPETNITKLIGDVATAMGVPCHIPKELSIVLKNGYNASKSLKSILRDVDHMLMDASWYMYYDLRQWVIYNTSLDVTTFEIAAFDESSGLLGVAPAKLYEYDKERPEILPPNLTWEVRTVLHPALAPNSVIHVNSSKSIAMTPINSKLLVESVEFIGDNQGGQYSCNILASARKEKK